MLIVGAGPTGLTLGLSLSSYGIASDIVDLKDGPSRDSKALAINPLSWHQLLACGAQREIGIQAQRVRRLNVLWNGVTRLNPIDLRWLDDEHNFFLIQRQEATELELLELLQKRGGAVQWNTEILRVDARDAAVSVECRSSRGVTTRTYEYVIGCDGKRSIVRDAIGARFEGSDYGMHLVLGDFDLNWDANRNEVHYLVYADTFFVMVPLGGTTWRVVVKHANDPPPGELPVSAIAEPVARYLGRDVLHAGPFWYSRAPLYVRTASTLRAGRLFIAGDAAHLYSPIGGTGMNTGIQDAINLGWKLAFTLRGWARPESLLASYEQERLPIIRHNAVATDWATRMIARQVRPEDEAERFIPTPSRRDVIRKQFPAVFSGMAMRYTASEVLAASGSHGYSERVGTINRGISAIVAKSPIIGQPLRVVTATEGALPLRYLRRIAEQSRRFMAVDCVAVGRTAPAFPERHLGAPTVILNDDAWRRSGLVPGELQIIRPDGVISFNGRCEASDGMIDHLKTLVCPSETTECNGGVTSHEISD